MTKVTITLCPKKDFPKLIEEMNREMREYTARAARGEREWYCSDCCCGDPNGMPDACFHGLQRCTEIIQRDKRLAMAEGNEPS